MSAFTDWASVEYERRQREKAAVAALEAAREDYPNPDATAETLRQAERAGVPAEVALRNPEEMLALERRQFLDMWVAQYPYQEWATRMAPLLWDSTEEVSNLTRGFDKVRALVKGAVGGVGSTFRGFGDTLDIGSRSLARTVGGEEFLASLEADAASIPEELRNWTELSRILWNFGDGLVQIADWIGPPKERETFWDEAAAGLGNIGAQVAAFAATGPVGAGVSLFGQGVDQMSQDVRNTGTWGTPEADIAAILGGAGIAAMDRFSLMKILQKVPGAKRAVWALTKDIGEKALIEGVQEGAEQGLQNTLAKLFYDPERTLMDGVPRSMVLGGVVGGSARGGTVAFSPKVRQGIMADNWALRADQATKTMVDLMAAADRTRLVERSPEAIRELTDLALGKQHKTLFAPADDLVVLFQKIGTDDARTLIQDLKLENQLVTARLTGGDVTVDVGDLLTSKTARKHGAELARHMRLDPEGMTQVEATRWRETDRRALIDDILERAALQHEGSDPAQAVYDRIYEARTQAGATPEVARHEATLWGEYYRRKAADMGGVDPLALFEDSAIRVTSPLTEQAQAFAGREDLPTLIGRMQGQENRTEEAAPGTVGEGRPVERMANQPASEGQPLSEGLPSPQSHLPEGQVFPDRQPDRQKDDVGSLRQVVEALGLDPDTASEAQIREALEREGQRREVRTHGADLSLDQAFRPRHAIEFTRRVDALLEGRLSREEAMRPVSLGPVSSQLSALGLSGKNLVIPTLVLRKILQGKHGSTMDPEVVRRLPDLIANPVAIFDSATVPGSYVLVLDAVDKVGNPVIVPVASVKDGHPPYIASTYGKTEFPRWLGEQLSAGRLRYVDTRKSQLLEKNSGVQFPGKPQTTDSGKRILTEADFVNPETLKQGENTKTGPFGPVFTEFRHDVDGAIQKLMTEQTGEAIAALHHPDIGDIDLVWGKAGTGASDGYGLAKLVKWHPEVLGDLQGILSAMGIVSRSANRINLDSTTHRAGIRLTWDDKAKHWLMTAFEKRNDSGDVTRTDIDALTGTDDTASHTTTVDTIIDQTLNNFYQKQDSGEGTTRGSFTRGKDIYGNPVNIIHLTGKANLSTFLHETGHFFLFDLVDSAYDPRATEPARQRLQADLQTTLTFMGVDLDVASSTPEAILAAMTQEHHETWARGFEAYLMRGKAPSSALKEAFARFRAWMLSVYRTLRGLNVDLSPEVTGVFDRLLATEEAIQTAEAEARFSIAPELAAFLSPEERETLEKLSRAATEEAKARLEAEAIADLKAQQTRDWREEKRKIKAEVAQEVGKQPVYRLLDVLMYGTMPDGRQLAPDERIRLDRDTLVETYGEAVLGLLPGPKNGRRRAFGPAIYTRNGVSHHVLAEEFGFSSGDEMIRKLLAVQDRAAVIAEKTDARMKERHGDLLTDGSLEREAIEAIHTDARGDAMMAELRALQRTAGVPDSPARLLKEAAQRMIAGMTVREAVTTHRFQRQLERLSREYGKALAAQDRPAAIAAQQKRVLAFHLHRESLKAAKEVETIRETLRSYTRRTVRERIGKAGADYLEQIDALLEQYEFRKVTNRQLDRRQSLRDWLAGKEQEDGGVPPSIPPQVLTEARQVNYRELSMEHLRGVYDAVRSIAHVARFKNKLLNKRARADLDSLAEEAVSQIEANSIARPYVDNPARMSLVQKSQRFVEGYVALFTKARTWFEQMDGGRGGFFDRHILEPIRQAEMALWKRSREEHGAFMALGKTFYGDDFGQAMRQEVWVNERVGSLSLEERLMVALNTGNESNLQALIQDRSRGWSKGDVDAILSTLTERDREWVQGVWTYIGRFWPEIAALEKRYRGIEPEKVEGTYFPLAYETREMGKNPLGDFARGREGRSVPQTADDLFSAFHTGQFAAAQTRQGHTIARKGSGGRPVKLSLDVITNHVQQVLSDLTLRDAVHDSWKLLHHPKVQNAIQDRMGTPVAEALDLWLKDVAVGQVRSSDTLSAALRHLRSGASVGVLGLKLMTAVQQLTGLAHSGVEIGWGAVAKGVGIYLKNPVAATQAVAEMSPFMASRGETQQRDIADALRTLEGKGWKGRWHEFLMMPMIRMQQVVDTITWSGAYNDALARGETTDRAVTLADTAVEAAQGSSLMSTLSGVERGTLGHGTRQSEVVKIFTFMYSYMATKINIAMRKTRGTDFHDPKQVLSLVADYFALFWLEGIVADLVGRMFRDDDDGDDENAMVRWFGLGLGNILGTLPLVRDVSGAVQGFGVSGGAQRSLESIGNTLGKLGKAVSGDDVDGFALTKSLLNATNALSPVKVPSGQIGIVLDAAKREEKGEDVPLVDYLFRPAR